MWRGLLADYKVHDVATVAHRASMSSAVSMLESSPSLASLESVLKDLPKWLDALKVRMVEPVLAALEQVTELCVKTQSEAISLENLRALNAEEHKETQAAVSKLYDVLTKLQQMVRRPSFTVVKDGAKQLCVDVARNMNILQATQIMLPLVQVAEKGDPYEIGKLVELHDPLFKFFGQGSGDIPGLSNEVVQQAMSGCFEAIVKFLLSWSAEPEPAGLEDTECITMFVSVLKAMLRRFASPAQQTDMQKQMRDLLVPLVDIACQLQTRIQSAVEVFVGQSSARLDVMHLKSVLSRLTSAEEAFLESVGEGGDDAEDEFIQAIPTWISKCKERGEVFLKEVAAILMKNQAEAVKLVTVAGQALVGAGKKGVWQRPPNKPNSESFTFPETQALAATSLLKGDYAQKVDELIKRMDQEPLRHCCKHAQVGPDSVIRRGVHVDMQGVSILLATATGVVNLKLGT